MMTPLHPISAPVLLVMLVLSMPLLASCDGFMDWEQDPDEVPLSEIIHLSRADGMNALHADGRDTASLIALLPRRASSRVVTFTTTAGSFLGSVKPKEVSVRAAPGTGSNENRLVAETVLVSDTVSTTAFVYARVGDFSDSLSIAFRK